MRFLLRIVPTAEPEPTVRILKGITSSIGGKAVNAKRTSYGAIEVDVFVPSRADFDLLLAAVEPLGKIEFYRDLHKPSRPMTSEEAVEEAVVLFNKERFWEAHEVLESVWRVSKGEEKTLLQGLILVCAAFVHEQKGEPDVALSVAKRAFPLLNSKLTKYHGIELQQLRQRLEKSFSAHNLTQFRI